MSFPDLNVYRGEQGNLETSVYRKPTHTDKYLPFNSAHAPLNRDDSGLLPDA